MVSLVFLTPLVRNTMTSHPGTDWSLPSSLSYKTQQQNTLLLSGAQSGALSLVEIVEILLSLVEIRSEIMIIRDPRWFFMA